MAFWDALSAGESREKVERKPEVSEVIYLEELYDIKKIICGYVSDSMIRCFLHTILGGICPWHFTYF